MRIKTQDSLSKLGALTQSVMGQIVEPRLRPDGLRADTKGALVEDGKAGTVDEGKRCAGAGLRWASAGLHTAAGLVAGCLMRHGGHKSAGLPWAEALVPVLWRAPATPPPCVNFNLLRSACRSEGGGSPHARLCSGHCQQPGGGELALQQAAGCPPGFPWLEAAPT